MKKLTFNTILLSALISLQTLGANHKASMPDLALTIYNDDFAVVRDTRPLEVINGTNSLQFTGIASSIDPTSVLFEPLNSDNSITILEQNYNYDLVNIESLLKRYLNRDISLHIKGSGSEHSKSLNGNLLSYIGNNIVLQTEDYLEVIDRNSIENISLKDLPGDLVTQPTLTWLVNSRTAGKIPCQTTYTTDHINWKSDYLAVLDQNDQSITFSGWVTIDNKSGAKYDNATIKLIAGDVKREKPQTPLRREKLLYYEADAAQGGFEEKPFMEYHLYTLKNKSTLLNNQIKQIQFIEPVENVKVNKKLVYELSSLNWLNRKNKVQVKIEFDNKIENSLGIPLPKGKVRVFKRDSSDNAVEFVGEDSINHTARDEKLSLYIGDAFDVVAETKITSAKHSTGYQRETKEIELKNSKNEDVVVYVKERVAKGYNLNISDNSSDYEKEDAYTMVFKVNIKANSNAIIEYTSTVTW